MAPADQLAPAGSSSYSSDTMTVGDGTWDFTTNDFLLPNLVGLNFETMRYNGMGHRFASIPQYHVLITGHGVLAAITFLFLIPWSVMTARFYTHRSGYAIRYHAYINIVAVLLATVVLVLGWFAVGPRRSLTNPHHGIGVAIYTLILLQAIGGRFVRHLAARHSLRLNVHRWSGRLIALLGIVQVPLGLTLYGSPKYLFILYTLWMSFLVFLYFVLSHRQDGRRDRDVFVGGGRSSAPAHSVAAGGGGGGGIVRWLGPLAAGAGIWALMRGRKHREQSRSRSRSRRASRSRVDSRSRSRSRSYVRREAASSRRASESFVEDEKMAANRRGNHGFMDKLLAAGAVAGAGALLANFMGKRKKREHDEEYSAVSTETPSRHDRYFRRERQPPPRQYAPRYDDHSEVTGYTEDSRDRPGSPTPGPRRHHGAATAAAAGAAAGAAAAGMAARRDRDNRPVTPRPSHQRTHSLRDDAMEPSEYSSYESPSRRTPPASGRVASAGKGLLAGMGLGWMANKFGRGSGGDDSARRRREEEDRRRPGGSQGPRYTGDGYGSPVRRDSRRQRPPPSQTHTYSDLSDSVYDAPPVPGHGHPVGAAAGGAAAGAALGAAAAAAAGRHGGAPPYPVTPGADPRHSHDTVRPVAMPDIPHDSESDSTVPAQGAQGRRRSDSRRRRDPEAYPPPASKPVSVKVKSERSGNITLRRLTDAEAAAERERASRGGGAGSSGQRRRLEEPSESASSLSGTDSPSNRRYRRDSSVRPAEASAERRTEASFQQQHPPPPAAQPPSQAAYPASSAPSGSGMFQPLNPPNPPFAGGRRPKDSAYFSGGQGAAGPSGSNPAAGRTMTSIESPGSHATWSAVTPSPAASAQPPDVASSAAAERRRRRRLERSDTGRQQNKVDYQ